MCFVKVKIFDITTRVLLVEIVFARDYKKLSILPYALSYRKERRTVLFLHHFEFRFMFFDAINNPNSNLIQMQCRSLPNLSTFDVCIKSD